MRKPIYALLAMLSAVALAADAAERPPRFRIEGEWRPQATSADGRFAVEAEARYTPAASTSGGRFTFKAVNTPSASCEPFPDDLFRDGFESP